MTRRSFFAQLAGGAAAAACTTNVHASTKNVLERTDRVLGSTPDAALGSGASDPDAAVRPSPLPADGPHARDVAYCSVCGSSMLIVSPRYGTMVRGRGPLTWTCFTCHRSWQVHGSLLAASEVPYDGGPMEHDGLATNPCPVCGTWLFEDPRPCWNCARLAAQ